MNINKLVSVTVISAVLLFTALPARAGIPVIDPANLVQSILQVFSWAKQALQMTNQITQLQQQGQQLRTMTQKFDGVRSLGTILNNPNINTTLPPEMRNATHLLINPSALSTSPANLNQIRASFGINTSRDPNAGQTMADTLGRAQQILASAQVRKTQLDALATHANSTPDAKSSLDMSNRIALEAANINNQAIQTAAALEAGRQAAELKQLAKQQAASEELRIGSAQPVRTLTY